MQYNKDGGMPDEQNGRDAQGDTSNTTATSGMQNGGAQDNPLAKWSREDLEKEIRNLQKEAIDRRKERDAAKKQAEDAAVAAAEAEKKRLAEAGEWEQLAKIKAAEAAKPFQEQAARYERTISETNAQLIQQIPEQMRVLIPDGLSVDQMNTWLIKSLPVLQRKPAPDTDAGAGQGGSGLSPLTDEEKAMAAYMGITHEAFAKAKGK